METIRLCNDLWEVEIDPSHHGRIVRLVDRAGTAYVELPQLAEGAVGEGGHAPFFGLDPWIKSGDFPDPNTAVLSAFAPIHGAQLSIREIPCGVVLEAKQAGLALTITWRLQAGQPLRCTMTLANESAQVDDFQIEGFFLWKVPAATWAQTAALLPGHAPVALVPYGQVIFEAGVGDGCAAWWKRGTTSGVALRGVGGLQKFFYGSQSTSFVLGPHSLPQRLAPGDAMTVEFDMAPLAWAQANGWACDTAAAEAELATREAIAAQTAAQVGSLREWAHAETPAIPWRALHMTLQYAPNDYDATLRMLEEIVAPGGFNMLMVEVDHAFPFQSHPKVAVPWAWSKAQWTAFVDAARGMGFEVLPQYNALGHQPESGLTLAYPEMAEDPGLWSLCPQHPNTVPYLLELIDELNEVFTPRFFHIGLDEIDMPSRPPSFCVCPKCREADGGELFSTHILALYAHLAGQGLEVMMWPDQLLYKPEHNSVNGLRTGMWKAIDSLPRDIIMVDWVYSPVKDYGGTTYLVEQGFRVMGATWHDARVMPPFTRVAVEHNLFGMCATTWSDPTYRDWPMVPVLMAAKYFQNPDTDYAPALAEAQALAAQFGKVLA